MVDFNSVKLFTLVSAICLLISCANMSSLQTARTVPARMTRLHLGGGYFSTPLAASASSGAAIATRVSSGYAELGMRYGIVDYLDLGVRLTLPGLLGLDIKKQLYEIDGLVFSMGAGIGYMLIKQEGSSGINSNLFDATLPLYASYDIWDNLAVYISPKAILRSYAGTSHTLLGGSGGLKIGNRSGLFLEASYFRDITVIGTGIPNSAILISAALFFGKTSSANSLRAPPAPPPTPEEMGLEPPKPVEKPTPPPRPDASVLEVLNAYVLTISQKRPAWNVGEKASIGAGADKMAEGQIVDSEDEQATLRLYRPHRAIRRGDPIYTLK